jgi:hypothetical protein
MLELPGTLKEKFRFYFIRFPLILIIIPIGFIFEFITTLPCWIICQTGRKR